MKKLLPLLVVALSFNAAAVDLEKAKNSLYCAKQAGVIALSFKKSLGDKGQFNVWGQKYIDHKKQAINHGLSESFVDKSYQEYLSSNVMVLGDIHSGIKIVQDDFAHKSVSEIQSDIKKYEKRRGFLTPSCEASETE